MSRSLSYYCCQECGEYFEHMDFNDDESEPGFCSLICEEKYKKKVGDE